MKLKSVLFAIAAMLAFTFEATAQCVPVPEVCNNLDDNCNGWIDEGNIVCPAPTWDSLYATDITQTSATLNWDAAPCGYTRVQYRKYFQSPITWLYANTTIGASSYVATGLMPSTLYEARIRTVCNPAYLSTMTVAKRWKTKSLTTPLAQPVHDHLDTPSEYFDMQGRYMGTTCPTSAGMYVKRTGEVAQLIVVTP